MRLLGKTTLLTGGAGNIGRVIAKRYLEEGAKVILTGRNEEKLKAAIEELTSANPNYKERLDYVIMDGAKPEAVTKGIAEITHRQGPIDILINNAGSAGPIQMLMNSPVSEDDLKQLKQKGIEEIETIKDAIGSLLGCPWFTTFGLLPHLNPQASIINISTIFSKTDYYGRIAYVVPKAALNVLSHYFAEELGKDSRAIRVNTVFPGPVESQRIDRAFSAMDKLKNIAPGTTKDEITSAMVYKSNTPSNYLTKEEIAETVVFLGTSASGGFSDHQFEVTHGLQHPEKSCEDIFSVPNPAAAHLNGHFTWIIAGDQLEEACRMAKVHYARGAEVLLTFREAETVLEAKKKLKEQFKLTIHTFDPINVNNWHAVINGFMGRLHYPNHIVILPKLSNKQMLERYGDSICAMTMDTIQDILQNEILEPIIIAHWLSITYRTEHYKPRYRPTVLFMSNSSDGKTNKVSNIRAAAIHQLIRTWRHEEHFNKEIGTLIGSNIWQIIRYENTELANLDCTIGLAIAIAAGSVTYPHIDLSIGEKIYTEPLSQFQKDKYNKLLGDLTNKVALITGGSEGIGRETARLLIEGGARVVIASRNKEKLEQTKAFFFDELISSGYSDPEQRIFDVLCDVTNAKTIATAFDELISKFGRIDFLINNAGITGQEQSVVDTSLDGWRSTMVANFISNYDLMIRSLPYMKKQGQGVVLNLSSQFGGMRSTTPSYPNRADYAVTKAAQRGLAEAFSPLIGPEVHINAVAPGPVEGDRIRGGASRPSLFVRRARVNFENRRMNLIYNALIELWRQHQNLTHTLELLALNKMEILSNSSDLDSSLKKIIQKLSADNKSSSATYLFTKEMFARVIKRLLLAHCLPKEFSEGKLLAQFVIPPDPYLPENQIIEDSAAILNKTLSFLSLKHMPSEYDIGREVALNLTNQCMTGETLYPSCGLSLENVAISGDFIGTFHPALYDYLQIRTVLIIGDAMIEEMAAIAEAYNKAKSVNKIIVSLGSKHNSDRLHQYLTEHNVPLDKIVIRIEALNRFDSVFDDVLSEVQHPDLVISFPWGELPKGSNWTDLPNTETFEKIVEEQITNHFQVVRRCSLCDHCRLICVTPSLAENHSKVTAAFAKLIQIALAPLVVTAAKETSRLAHQATIYQIDAHQTEGVRYRKGLVDAVLTLSLPDNCESGAILGV